MMFASEYSRKGAAFVGTLQAAYAVDKASDYGYGLDNERDLDVAITAQKVLQAKTVAYSELAKLRLARADAEHYTRVQSDFQAGMLSLSRAMTGR